MYNGHDLDEFVVQRTSAYIDQVGFRHSFVSSLGTGPLQEQCVAEATRINCMVNRTDPFLRCLCRATIIYHN